MFKYQIRETEKEPRICPICRKQYSGRADKLYCSKKCKNDYKNSFAKDRKAQINRINEILLNNRKIIVTLIPPGKDGIKVKKHKLEENHFDFKYHTSTAENKQGKTYYYCYDYGYIHLTRDLYFLVKNNI